MSTSSRGRRRLQGWGVASVLRCHDTSRADVPGRWDSGSPETDTNGRGILCLIVRPSSLSLTGKVFVGVGVPNKDLVFGWGDWFEGSVKYNLNNSLVGVFIYIIYVFVCPKKKSQKPYLSKEEENKGGDRDTRFL